MTWLQMIIAYSVAWWLVFFMVLPFSAQAPKTPGKGHVPSAPDRPNLKKKAWITTGLAVVPVLLFKLLYDSGVLQL
jgi:predicted secreted protein